MSLSPPRQVSRTWVLSAVGVTAATVTCLNPASAIAMTAQPGGGIPAASDMDTAVSVSTQAALVSAVAAATPGTTISLSAGTYSGGLVIKHSGTAQQPIVIQAAGDGPVTLTATLAMPRCYASSPDQNRTVRFAEGASYWTVRGLNIDGGVWVSGYNSLKAHQWFADRVHDGSWAERRAVPARGVNDPAGARDAIPYLETQVNATLRPALGINIVDDVITRKGIHVTMGQYGVISGNQITDVACGTGPGIWFGTYSDGWTISGNTVSRIAHSTRGHYMQEGIRIDGASNYNLIEDNLVVDLPTVGRAYTTDQDASYNTFRNNTAQDVSIGYNEEMSGWGNRWEYNTVTGYRAAGFAFRMMDNLLVAPSMNTSTFGATVRCNTASGVGSDLKMGASNGSQLSSNAFQTVTLSKNLRAYWATEGNTWNGTSIPPTAQVQGTLEGC